MNIVAERIAYFFPENSDSIIAMFDTDKIYIYLQFLQTNNERGGFFSKKDEELILDRHIVESVYHIYILLAELNVSRETKVADIGTGPGLPGFLFYCLRDFPQLTLIDSQKRRLGILQEWVDATFEGHNIKFDYRRAEDIRENFDLVISRAFIQWPWSAEVVCRMVKTGGYYSPFAGTLTEPDNEEDILASSGFEKIKIIHLEKLDFLGTRHIKLLKKVTGPSQNFPRAWKIITKEIKDNNG